MSLTAAALTAATLTALIVTPAVPAGAQHLAPQIVTANALASSVAAQSTSPLTLTVEQAIERALTNSHRVDEMMARGEAASAVTEQRHAVQLPRVNAQGGYTRTNHVDQFGIQLPNGQLRIIYPDIPDNYRSRVDAQWPLYTGGRLQALEQAARRVVHDLRVGADSREVGRADQLLLAALQAGLDLVLHARRGQVALARQLVREGVKEINLISQDTTFFGMDTWEQRPNPRTPVDSSRGTALTTLLRELNAIEGIGELHNEFRNQALT